jgi:hypothetical protein
MEVVRDRGILSVEAVIRDLRPLLRFGKRHPEALHGKSPPLLVALAGYRMDSDIHAAKEAGFDAHIANRPMRNHQ